MAAVTCIVPSNLDVLITGITRIEISARKVKAWGVDPTRVYPLYTLYRSRVHDKSLEGAGFPAIVEYLRCHGERGRE